MYDNESSLFYYAQNTRPEFWDFSNKVICRNLNKVPYMHVPRTTLRWNMRNDL